MIGHAVFLWVNSLYEEIQIPVEFELDRNREIISLKFPSDDAEGKEFAAAYVASASIQEAVDEACYAAAEGRHFHPSYVRSLN